MESNIETKNKTYSELIQNFNKGCVFCETELYDRTKDYIKKYLNKYYPHNNNEDFVADIIIKIFNNINRFDDRRGKFSTWATEIIKNELCSKHRKKHPKIDYHGDNEYLDNIQIICEPIFYYQNSILHQNLSDSISLTKEDYKLLELKYVYGYTFKEIGTMFNRRTTTISNRVHYLKTKIKQTSNY